MKSKIYFGHLLHKRVKPKLHEFEYRTCMFYLDLDEVGNIFDRFLLWSKDRINIASFKTTDYLNKSGDIKHAVNEKIVEKFGVQHDGPIRMLTHLRYWGYCFNPVTFYYCFNKTTANLDFLVAEINNTPWDERFSYCFDNRQLQLMTKNGKSIEMSFDKAFHVSPFLPMEMQCYWRFSLPTEKLNVYMKNSFGDEKAFHATLGMQASPINRKTLAKVLFAYPAMTAKVSLGIYWQALKLWLKGIPFISHPKNDEKSKGVIS